MINKAQKPTEILMRQKINVTPRLVESWKENMTFEIQSLIHSQLLNTEDYGLKFKHQEREFEIVGMTKDALVMLREIVDEQPFYWECTSAFAQLKLDRKYYEWVEIAGIKTTQVMEYDRNRLFLPNRTAKRRIKKEEEEVKIEDVEVNVIEYIEEIEEQDED